MNLVSDSQGQTIGTVFLVRPLIASDQKAREAGLVLSPCPPDPDEVAETYLMGRMPESELTAYERHFLSCPDFVERLENARTFIESTRAAARKGNGRS